MSVLDETFLIEWIKILGRFHIKHIYIFICSLRFPRMGSMLLEIFPVSPCGFERFTRRFGSPFGVIFKKGGGWSTLS